MEMSCIVIWEVHSGAAVPICRCRRLDALSYLSGMHWHSIRVEPRSAPLNEVQAFCFMGRDPAAHDNELQKTTRYAGARRKLYKEKLT